MRASSIVNRQSAGFVLCIARGLPCCDFSAEGFLIRNPSVHALARQYAKLAFSHVQPTSVLGYIYKFELVQQLSNHLWRKRGV